MSGHRARSAAHAAHDLLLQAMAGALAGGPDVIRIGVPWVDLATATSAAFAITAAWHAGRGGHLDATGLVMGLRQYSYVGALLGLTLALDDESFLAGGERRH